MVHRCGEKYNEKQFSFVESKSNPIILVETDSVNLEGKNINVHQIKNHASSVIINLETQQSINNLKQSCNEDL